MSLAVLVIPVVQLDWQPLWTDNGIPLAIMGLVVVFAALTLLRVFIGLLPKIMAILDRISPEEVEAAPQPRTTKPMTSDIPEDVVVVIAAAVAATIAEPHRIVRTRALSPSDLSWSLEGRLQHHTSHQIHPRKPN